MKSYDDEVIKKCLELTSKRKIKILFLKLDYSVKDEMQKQFSCRLSEKVVETVFCSSSNNQVSAQSHLIYIHSCELY